MPQSDVTMLCIQISMYALLLAIVVHVPISLVGCNTYTRENYQYLRTQAYTTQL